ncbi:MAG: YceI family protein [Myxococcota bacterium]|jgi:polyisoprenoid-binding protein YceI|nr:YceI family protein [Myxococcota bacterium]
MRVIITPIVLLSMALGGCAKDPSKDVVAAKVGPTKAAQPASKPAAKAPEKPQVKAAAAQGIALDGSIIFIGSKVTGSHKNRFSSWIATAEQDDKGELSSLSVVIQTKEMQADFESPTKWSAKLETHLRDDDFFASATHPTATFQLDTVTPVSADSKGATHNLSGRFTIRGITKAISFPATISNSPFAAQAEFSINRKDFGMKFDGKADNLIRDGVVLQIELKAK